ncbi:MAG: hypothetical protein JO098_03570, partial [Candidatus Eremiobacteraeota bacterium]|nr:hypothetical protein [Candidatus Eremiobacteraeota bacterium]
MAEANATRTARPAVHASPLTSTPRGRALLRGVAQWRDPQSTVRREARAALRDGEWPVAVVEAALDAVLHDAEAVLSAT